MATAANWREKLRQTEALAPDPSPRVSAKTVKTAKSGALTVRDEAFDSFGSFDNASEYIADDNPNLVLRKPVEGQGLDMALECPDALPVPSGASFGDQPRVLPTPDDFEERAAIVEYGAGVPRAWAEGFARLDTCCRPRGFSKAQWQQVIDDGGRFLDGGWAQKAAAIGWTATDIFGVHPLKPRVRFDAMGLVSLIRGGDVIDVQVDRAVIRMPTGNNLTYYLRRHFSEAVTLWELET
jgi:hypothetical protein